MVRNYYQDHTNNSLEILDSSNGYAEVIPGGGRVVPPNQSVQGGNYLFVKDNRLIVFCSTYEYNAGSNFIWVYDISDPENPLLLVSYPAPNYTCNNWKICYDGKYIYMFSTNEQASIDFHRMLTIYDASDWTYLVPTFFGTYDTSGFLDSIPHHTACGCYPNGFTQGGNSYIP